MLFLFLNSKENYEYIKIIFCTLCKKKKKKRNVFIFKIFIILIHTPKIL